MICLNGINSAIKVIGDWQFVCLAVYLWFPAVDWWRWEWKPQLRSILLPWLGLSVNLGREHFTVAFPLLLYLNCTLSISQHISAVSGNNKHQEKYGNFPCSKSALFHVPCPDVLSAVRRRSVHILHYGYSYTAVSAPGEFISIITCAITVEYLFQDIWGSCPPLHVSC